MVKGTLTVINENGEEDTITSRGGNKTVIIRDGEKVEPAVVERVEYDHEGVMSQIQTVCGETENRRETDDKPDLTVEGILLKSQLDMMKSLQKGEQLKLISDLGSGDVIVQRITVEQTTDIVSFTPSGGGDTELAFPFQLQLKAP